MNLLWSWVSILGSFTFTLQLEESLSVIESGVGFGNFWVENMDLLWLKILLSGFLGFIIT
jgi:hypothetical protein